MIIDAICVNTRLAHITECCPCDSQGEHSVMSAVLVTRRESFYQQHQLHGFGEPPIRT